MMMFGRRLVYDRIHSLVDFDTSHQIDISSSFWSLVLTYSKQMKHADEPIQIYLILPVKIKLISTNEENTYDVTSVIFRNVSVT